MKRKILLPIYAIGAALFVTPSASAQFGGLLKEMIQPSANSNGEAQSEEGYEEQNVAVEGLKGAAVCGGLTSVFGGSKKATLIAGGVCGVANAGYTALANKGAAEYAAEYGEINKRIVTAEKDIARLEKDIGSANAKNAKYNKSIDDLTEKDIADKRFIRKASSIREKLDDELRDVRQSRITTEARLAVIDEDLQEMKKMVATYPDIEELQSTRTALLDQKSELTEAIKRSNGVEQDLSMSIAKVDNEIVIRS